MYSVFRQTTRHLVSPFAYGDNSIKIRYLHPNTSCFWKFKRTDNYPPTCTVPFGLGIILYTVHKAYKERIRRNSLNDDTNGTIENQTTKRNEAEIVEVTNAFILNGKSNRDELILLEVKDTKGKDNQDLSQPIAYRCESEDQPKMENSNENSGKLTITMEDYKGSEATQQNQDILNSSFVGYLSSKIFTSLKDGVCNIFAGSPAELSVNEIAKDIENGNISSAKDKITSLVTLKSGDKIVSDVEENVSKLVDVVKANVLENMDKNVTSILDISSNDGNKGKLDRRYRIWDIDAARKKQYKNNKESPDKVSKKEVDSNTNATQTQIPTLAEIPALVESLAKTATETLTSASAPTSENEIKTPEQDSKSIVPSAVTDAVKSLSDKIENVVPILEDKKEIVQNLLTDNKLDNKESIVPSVVTDAVKSLTDKVENIIPIPDDKKEISQNSSTDEKLDNKESIVPSVVTDAVKSLSDKIDNVVPILEDKKETVQNLLKDENSDNKESIVPSEVSDAVKSLSDEFKNIVPILEDKKEILEKLIIEGKLDNKEGESEQPVKNEKPTTPKIKIKTIEIKSDAIKNGILQIKSKINEQCQKQMEIVGLQAKKVINVSSSIVSGLKKPENQESK
ncbi:hypothetical protein RDWZM_009060 [Blomia tropicalis]|uniref:Uncharacterized protein n=1 Tax=Blomia tropicalis TaxID=40697 RepID=A0A9Q0M397_BLOTA|nr:hypothetical protein RDWZM_009060 [Blomia tropicalis]